MKRDIEDLGRRIEQLLAQPEYRDHPLREALDGAIEAGALNPRIALRVPLKDTARAHDAVESGSLIGNTVIDIG